MYRTLITVSLLLVAGSSGYMSVYGLMSVFASSAKVIVCMGLGMEVGKILIVSHVYRQWRKLNGFQSTLYILIVSFLVFLTSMEVTGFLTQSHVSITHDLQINENVLNSLKEEAAILEEQISIIDNTLAGLPISHVSRRIKEREVVSYDKKQERLLEISKQKAQLEAQIIKDREFAGPIFAVARVMKINATDAIAIFILFLVLVLEPLSIGLTVAANAAWIPAEKMSEMKSQPPLQTRDPADVLMAICKEYQLTISELASITDRKKQKTCERWLNRTAPVPDRALRAVQAWANKQNFELTQDKKVITIAQK